MRVHFRKFLLFPLPNVALQNGRTALDAIVQHLALQDAHIPLTVIVRATRFLCEMGGTMELSVQTAVDLARNSCIPDSWQEFLNIPVPVDS